MNPLAALGRDGSKFLELAKQLARGNPPEECELEAAALLLPMRGAPHDPVHHQEGDPLTHTHMVALALVSLPEFTRLPDGQRLALAIATLLHDVAKPQTAIVADGRVSHPNHAPRGARKVRSALYAAGLDPAIREAAAALARRHMQPHHVLRSLPDDVALLRWMAAVSLEVPVRLLLMLAQADAQGRISQNADDSPALLIEFAQEHDLLDRPFPFADRNARLECCRDALRDPRFPSGRPEDGPTLTVLSGLPASGKSTLAHALEKEGAVRISVEDRLDAGVERGRAVQDAKEALRQALRTQKDAVWDATMLTRSLRRQIVSIAERYGARCRIVSVELPEIERAARNRERAQPVPDDAILGMLAAWEMPTFDEALMIEGRPERMDARGPTSAHTHRPTQVRV